MKACSFLLLTLCLALPSVSMHFDPWSTPLTNNLYQAEKELREGFSSNPLLGFRLALCMSLLNRNREDVLSVAQSSAMADESGFAKFYYGLLLNESDPKSAQLWFDAAGKLGIGWDEYIRQEQRETTGIR